MTKDPVCGMQLLEERAEGSCDFKGKMYYFCTQACREQFIMNPEEYTKEEYERKQG